MTARGALLSGGLALAILAGVCCTGRGDSVYHESDLVMGTVVEITVAHSSESQARAAIREALAELRRADELMSLTRAGSAVFRANNRQARRVAVGAEVFGLLREALAVSAASGGAFDPTIWPVAQLWGFESGGAVPDERALGERLRLVGYRQLHLFEGGHAVEFALDGMGIDLGAIAKGWAIDRAVEKLVARGVRDAIVDAGGDLRIIGGRPGKGFWRIGVKNPRPGRELLATFDLRDTAIVTSGDYERFFEAGGVRYHHILDPATGQPARGCQSVTVLAPTAAEADACATAAFVLGPARGLAFLQARPGVRGLIVGADGGLHWTDAALERMARR